MCVMFVTYQNYTKMYGQKNITFRSGAYLKSNKSHNAQPLQGDISTMFLNKKVKCLPIHSAEPLY